MFAALAAVSTFDLSGCNNPAKPASEYVHVDTLYIDLKSIDSSIISQNNSAADMVIASSYKLLAEPEKLEIDSANEVIRIHRVPTFGMRGRNDAIIRIALANERLILTYKKYQLIGGKPACIVNRQLMNMKTSYSIRNSLTTYRFWEQPVQLSKKTGSFESYLYIITGLKQQPGKPEKRYEIYRYTPLDSATSVLAEKMGLK